MQPFFESVTGILWIYDILAFTQRCVIYCQTNSYASDGTYT